MVYVLVTGEGNSLEVDQMVESLVIAKREKRDLEKMGCVVKIKTFANWEEAEAFESKLRGW